MHNHLSGVGLGYRLPDGSSLFHDLTFSFGPTRTGLVGRNGVGKTTLLEILAGLRSASAGSLTQAGRISYLPQRVTFSPTATVADALQQAEQIAAHERVACGEGSLSDFDLLADQWDLPERIERGLAKLGVSHLTTQRTVSSLSGGELTRVRLAGLLLAEPDFLLLDEPTNHLDQGARAFVYDLVANWRKGLLVVSHDRHLLSLVTQIAELQPDGLQLYGGDFAFYQEQRALARLAAEQTLHSTEQRLKDAKLTAQRARERQERHQAHGRKTSGRQNLPAIVAGKLQRDAENTAARLRDRHAQKVEYLRQELQVARGQLPIETQIKVDLASSVVPPQKRLVELRAVNYRFADTEQELWSQPLSWEIIGPERIWLRGANGAGKSTLLDLLCSKKRPSAGTLHCRAERVGFLDQQVSLLDDSLSVLDNLRRVAPLRPEHELRTLLGRFLFIRDDALKSAAVLSGGERMRAGLACLLGAEQAPELLIADEPTNNLDLPSLAALSAALHEFRGALLVATHDATFAAEIGLTREIVLGAQPLLIAGWGASVAEKAEYGFDFGHDARENRAALGSDGR